jgi:hypothetical protein
MAGGGCSLISSVSKRNGGVMSANHSRRGGVGVGRLFASKRRRRAGAAVHCWLIAAVA